jgi:hypothetical protein
MALMFAGDIRKWAFDATVLTDGKNLMTMVGNSFLALDDVTLEHTGDGRDIGTFTADGSPRTTPIFTLSPGVRAEIFHFDPGIPSGGLVEARVYHINGTDAPVDAFNPSGKRQFWFSIDEMTSSISAPTM